MKKLGIIVNPVAGMGGRVGFKGTDGVETLRKARELEAKPESPQRAAQALKVLVRIKDRIQVITCPNEMGESACRECGFSPAVLRSIRNSDTSGEDTREAARQMVTQGVNLLLFAGGDGTARDICNAVGAKVPVLGIPAGVKIHSAVYAVTPQCAGEAAAMFLTDRLMNIREAEVMDIDEDAFRRGGRGTTLWLPPCSRREPVCSEREIWNRRRRKGGSPRNCCRNRPSHGRFRALVCHRSRHHDACHNGSPEPQEHATRGRRGSQQAACGQRRQRESITCAHQGKTHKLVVTAIGGQGHVFGRGNQQISSRVIRLVGRENIVVIATKEKLASFSGRPLLADTGDEGLNDELSGYLRVITGLEDYVMYKLGYQPARPLVGTAGQAPIMALGRVRQAIRSKQHPPIGTGRSAAAERPG